MFKLYSFCLVIHKQHLVISLLSLALCAMDCHEHVVLWYYVAVHDLRSLRKRAVMPSLNDGKCDQESEYGCHEWARAYLRLSVLARDGTWADVMGATHTAEPLLLGGKLAENNTQTCSLVHQRRLLQSQYLSSSWTQRKRHLVNDGGLVWCRYKYNCKLTLLIRTPIA